MADDAYLQPTPKTAAMPSPPPLNSHHGAATSTSTTTAPTGSGSPTRPTASCAPGTLSAPSGYRSCPARPIWKEPLP